MTRALIVGPDRGLEAALADRGVETVRVERPATRESLTEAGVADADLFVLTAVEEATGVPVARELNPDVRVVVYDEASMPEFVRGQVDLAVDPALLDPAVVAEELVGTA